MRIGITRTPYSALIIQQLEKSPASAGLFFESPAQLVDALMMNECDAAFLSPIEFAKSSSDFSLYQSLTVSSFGESNSVVLLVKNDIQSISTVAFNAATASEIILTKIILAEQFESDVAFVPVLGNVQTMFAKADAVLLTGDAASSIEWDGTYIDIVSEWSEMTELPFVHVVCAGRNDKKNSELQSVLHNVEQELPATHTFDYRFNQTTRTALDEFFRYAFYHGVLPDVPEINVFEK